MGRFTVFFSVAILWMLIVAAVWWRMQVEKIIDFKGESESEEEEIEEIKINNLKYFGDEQVEETESDIQSFLGCIRSVRLFDLDDEEFWSHPGRGDAILCKDMFRGVQFSYESSGCLPPGYAGAVKAWFKGNQTLADFAICRLDHRRCPQQIADVLWGLDEDDHQVPFGFHDPRFRHVFY